MNTSKLNINLLQINFHDNVNVNASFYEKVPRHFWRILIVTLVLASREYEIRKAIVRLVKTNKILKRSVNKLFTVENTFHEFKQADKVSSPAAL